MIQDHYVGIIIEAIWYSIIFQNCRNIKYTLLTNSLSSYSLDILLHKNFSKIFRISE